MEYPQATDIPHFSPVHSIALRAAFSLRELLRSPLRVKTLKLTEKLGAFLSAKRDECRTRIVEASTVIMCEQRPKRSGLTVPIRADHHKGRFGEALGLEPGLAATRAIGCQRML